jgi:hypothetical protein
MSALGILFVSIGVGKASVHNLQIIKNFLLCWLLLRELKIFGLDTGRDQLSSKIDNSTCLRQAEKTQ